MAKRKKQGRGGKNWVETPDTPMNNPFASLGQPSDKPSPVPEAPRETPEVKPTAARAVIRVQRKGRGGKTATVISHLGLPDAVMKVWCKALRKQMGCGGQVEGDLLVFAGDQRERVAKLLLARGVRRITQG